MPRRADWLPLAITSAGVVFGFPLLTSVAMRYVEAVHASVIVGVLPLATAAVGAWLHRQRPSAGFWVCAAIGSALVVAFAVLRSGEAGFGIQAADALLLARHGLRRRRLRLGRAAVAPHARRARDLLGAGDRAAAHGAGRVARPAPGLGARRPPGGASRMSACSRCGSGFFAWYRGLALGGTVRVSQVQLVQPFLGMLFAVPLLGESLDAVTLGFALAVIAVVFIGKRMPVRVAA